MWHFQSALTKHMLASSAFASPDLLGCSRTNPQVFEASLKTAAEYIVQSHIVVYQKSIFLLEFKPDFLRADLK